MTGVLWAGAAALIVALFGTPWLVRLLTRLRIGQPIHDAVTQHAAKAGTPTMGGVIIPIGLVAGYLAAHVATGRSPSTDGLVLCAVVAGAGLIGVTDDWLKVRRGRNLGLREAQKTIMQAGLIVGFCLAYLNRPHPCTHLSVVHCASAHWDPGPWGWSIFAAVVLWATANAVNFTDGIEGLLSGSAAVTFLALAIIGFWQFRHPSDFDIPNSLDLTVVAASLAGACTGFLWTNIRPATIFMGDSGSLAIGTGIAALALSQHIALLIPIIGALYVIEGASSSLQRYTYKWYFKSRGGGRRLFRMAPLHHHYELVGWPESTIVVRFWIINATAAATAIVIFYSYARK